MAPQANSISKDRSEHLTAWRQAPFLPRRLLIAMYGGSLFFVQYPANHARRRRREEATTLDRNGWAFCGEARTWLFKLNHRQRAVAYPEVEMLWPYPLAASEFEIIAAPNQSAPYPSAGWLRRPARSVRPNLSVHRGEPQRLKAIVRVVFTVSDRCHQVPLGLESERR